MLRWSLRHRWVIVATCVGLLVITPTLFRIVGFDFLPRDDQSEFEVAITLPEGYTLDRADKLFAEIEGRLAKLRGVEAVFTTIGDTTGRMIRGQGDVTTGTIYLRITDLEKRQRKAYDPMFWINALAGRVENDEQHFTQFDVQRDARQIMQDYPELRVCRAGRLRVRGLRVPPGDGRDEPPRPGPGQAGGLLQQDHPVHARTSRASWTSTRACRCASPSCA